MDLFLLLLLLLGGCPFTFVSSGIINRSPCIFKESKGLLNCRGEGLTEIPYDYFQNKRSRIVDLGMNKIRSVNEIWFFKLPYRNEIKEIRFDNNQLAELPHHLFSNLPGVQILDLTNNLLRHIDHQLCHMSSLRELFLNGNPIETISSHAFNCLRNLKFLHLVNCSITKLPIDVFKGTSLEYIDLSGNHIKNLDKVFIPENATVLPDPKHFQLKKHFSNVNDKGPKEKENKWVFIVICEVILFLVVILVAMVKIIPFRKIYKKVTGQQHIIAEG